MNTQPPSSHPSRLVLVCSALLFAVLLMLSQDGLLVLGSTLVLPFPATIFPWFGGTPLCSALLGKLSAVLSTRGLEPTAAARWGQLTGLLTGLFGAVLATMSWLLLLVWSAHTTFAAFVTNPGCSLSSTSTSFCGLITGLIFFGLLIDLCWCAPLALLGGRLGGRVRAWSAARSSLVRENKPSSLRRNQE